MNQHFRFVVQFVFPARLIWFWFAGWWLGSVGWWLIITVIWPWLMRSIITTRNVVGSSTLHLAGPGSPRSFIIRNLGRWLTGPWPNGGLSVTMTPHHTSYSQPGLQVWALVLCDTVTACLMSVQMLSEDQDLAPYTARGWVVFGPS